MLKFLCVFLLYCISFTQSQDISGTDAVDNATTTNAPVVCLNGRMVGGMCICSPGWAGLHCDICNNARIR